MSNEKAMQMLTTALEMEEKGKSFYDKAVNDCKNEVAAKLFKLLSDDEVVHTERIKQIFDRLNGGEGWNEDWAKLEPGHKSLTKVFRELAKEHGKDVAAADDDVKALDIGIDFEAKAITFYEKHLGDTTGELEKKFVEKMIAEEKSHHEALVDMKFFLTDPEGWYTDKEHHSLDGA